MKGIRVGLAGCGWGIVLGAVVAVVLYGPSGEFGGAVAMVLIGGVIGGAVGAVLGCPVALVTAALTYQEPRRAARVAVFVFCLAGFAFMGAWLAAMEPSGRDGVIVDTQYSNLSPDGYTDAVIAALWPAGGRTPKPSPTPLG